MSALWWVCEGCEKHAETRRRPMKNGCSSLCEATPFGCLFCETFDDSDWRPATEKDLSAIARSIWETIAPTGKGRPPMTSQRDKAFEAWWERFLREWGANPLRVERDRPTASHTARSAWDAAREKYEVLEDIADKYGYECPKCGAPLERTGPVAGVLCHACGFQEGSNATTTTPPKVPADCPKCGMQLRLDGDCVKCGELTSKADICYHCEVHPGDRYCPDPCPKGKSVKGPVEVTSVGSVTKEGGH